MMNYPKLNELCEAFMKDCYDYILRNSDEENKNEIKKLLEENKDKSEIIQKSYVIFSSVENKKPSKDEFSSIFTFTKGYINAIYEYIKDINKNIDIVSSINDCCNTYIALFGYLYIFKGVYDNEFLKFFYEYYYNFAEVINKYKISDNITKYYNSIESKVYLSLGVETIEVNDNLFKEWIKHFEKESYFYQQKETTNKNMEEINKNGNNETQQTSNTDNLLNGEADNEIKTSQIEDFNLNKEDSEIKSSNLEAVTSEDKYVLKKEFENMKFFLKNYILLSRIESAWRELNIYENLILGSEFNLAIIYIEKKRSEYLENIICSLKNNIQYLGNPYNFNLWRKLCNIILKNIFVILYKKNYIISQYNNSSVLKELEKFRKRLEGKQLESYNIKLENYKNELKKINLSSKGNSSANKERNYNIIIVEKNEKYSLAIDFLFFLKERGNKMAHFDKDIIDLILFNDLNIKVIEDEKINKEEVNNTELEKESEIKNEKYNGKTTFDYKEIIEMFQNPFKYHKKEINVDEICNIIYNKIESIKKTDNYIGNTKKLSSLKNDSEKLDNKINELMTSYENFFIENNINYMNQNENEILCEDIKESKENYNYLKDIKEKNKSKIQLYEKIQNELVSLNNIKEEKVKEINVLIKEIKNEPTRKIKLITLLDVFKDYKMELGKTIITNEEYKSYSKIFNAENIDKFTIEDVFTFLNENLNYSNTMFSIIKKDITNFNFLVEVITSFNELKNFVYNQDLDILI